MIRWLFYPVFFSSLDHSTKANEALRRRVPDDWMSVQSTKACGRYHTPFVAEKYKQLLAMREQLDLDVDDAWMTFLDEFNIRQYDFQRAVQVNELGSFGGLISQLFILCTRLCTSHTQTNTLKYILSKTHKHTHTHADFETNSNDFEMHQKE